MANASTVEITAGNFKDVVERDGIVLVDWWAPWCGPCRVFGPTFEKVAQKNPDITFGKVNTEDEPELAGAFNIRSIPTLMIFRDRVLLFNEPGMLPKQALQEILKQVRALDMDEVRKQIAAEEAAQRAEQEKESKLIVEK